MPYNMITNFLNTILIPSFLSPGDQAQASSRRNHLEIGPGACSPNIRPRATGYEESAIANKSVSTSRDIQQQVSGGLIGTALDSDITLASADVIVKLRLE